MAQERAMQDDDQTWMGGDDENYTITEPDRNVSTIFFGYFNFRSSIAISIWKKPSKLV